MKKLSRKFPIFSNLPECSKLSRKGNGFFLEVEADDAYVREGDRRLMGFFVLSYGRGGGF